MNVKLFSKAGFYSRIEEILRREGIKPVEFERRIGMRGALTRWKKDNDRDHPKPDSLILIKREFNVSIDWLLTGEQSSLEKTRILQPIITVAGSYPAVPDGVSPEDYLAVPLVDAEIAAGYLSEIPEEYIISLIWIARADIGRRQHHNLRAIRLASNADSMRRTLNPGDIVVIDPTERPPLMPIRRYKMYAVRSAEEGGCAIKRVREQDDCWILLSDNPAHDPILLRKDKNKNPIIGQVIWSCRSWL